MVAFCIVDYENIKPLPYTLDRDWIVLCDSLQSAVLTGQVSKPGFRQTLQLSASAAAFLLWRGHAASIHSECPIPIMGSLWHI